MNNLNKDQKPLLILAGPTAVGKTKLSIELAKRLSAEIISADSMQVYRFMNIGTAKITKEEMQGVPHHLIDCIDPRDEWNVMKFKRAAKQCINDIYSRGNLPFIVGGTGFYIQALLYDIEFTHYAQEQEVLSSIREDLELFCEEKGEELLHLELSRVDPDSAASIHKNNKKRVIRALEYYRQTGVPFSVHNREQRERVSPYSFLYFVLDDERNTIYKQIDHRVDQMIKRGLLDEVENLMQMGYQKELISMQGLGYKELFRYFNKEILLEEAVSIIKRDTRHFAKRQLTWFRREKELIFLNRQDFSGEEAIEQEIIKQSMEKWCIC